VLWLWLGIAGGLKTGLVVIGLIAALLIGWMAPRWWVQQAASKRLNQIDYDMPELIDLLVVTVEAGLGLGASLQLASTRLGGPLGEELRIATREQTMGLPLLAALENMQNRCPTPAVRSFVRAMIQGERLGISIGQILRSLALEMRKRRRAKAEEKAQKAPIKILFPLIFLIFPAMFLVLLGPALFSIFDALKGK
jgi:tight adherence protein C